MTLESTTLIKSNEKIAWVLFRPNMSSWLKNALSTARDRDPIAVLNDPEILNHVLRARSNARIQSTLEKNTEEPSEVEGAA
jgi:hypothetical protein